MHVMTKNPKSNILDILTILNFYMDIMDLFCREFKYLQHLLTNYIQTYILD